MKDNVKCDTCQKHFHKKPSKIKKHNFCSRDCYFNFKRRIQIVTECERCGKVVTKPPSKKTNRNFCSNQCKMRTLNEELNPTRMNMETRLKIRKARLGTGAGLSYEKTFGRHTHRIVAEQKLGRPLKHNEVVHHIDGDHRNNHTDNLMVFSSAAEHLNWHRENDPRFWFRGGDPFRV